VDGEQRESKGRASRDQSTRNDQLVGKAGRKDGSRGNKRVRHTGRGHTGGASGQEEEESLEKGRNKSAPSVKVIS